MEMCVPNKTETQIAFEGPAVAANRMIVSMAGDQVRIAFLEGAPDNEGMFFRTATILSTSDAAALKDLLAGLLTRNPTSKAN